MKDNNKADVQIRNNHYPNEVKVDYSQNKFIYYEPSS